MGTLTPFNNLAHNSPKFSEASHIFVKNGLWQMSASTCQTAWQMSASLASPNIFRFWGILYSPDLKNLSKPWKNIILLFWQVSFFSKMALGNVGKSSQYLPNCLGNVGKSGESLKIAWWVKWVWGISENIWKGHFWECKVLKKKVFFGKYSQTCVQRPPLGPEKVSVWKRCLIKLRFRLVIDETNWLLFTGGRYSQVVIKSGLTVSTFAKFACKWP